VVQARLVGGAAVDVTVELPAACFLQKDHLNHRSHAKRALYLCRIADAVAAARACNASGCRLIAGLGGPRTLVLCFTSAQHSVPVCVHAALPEGHFPATKLAPGRNALRSAGAASADSAADRSSATAKDQVPAADGVLKQGANKRAFSQLAGGCGKAAGDLPEPLPTPVYNASVLWSMAAHGHFTRLAAILASEDLQRAALLLVAWQEAQLPRSCWDTALSHALWISLAAQVEQGTLVHFLPC
jgi:Nrap protein domain 1